MGTDTVKEYYKAVCRGEEVRQNLISLRGALKNEQNQRAFAYFLGGDFHVFQELLGDEDPKVRKNAALILGDMETEDVLPCLYAAYQKEDTLFVRTDYLKAMEKMDYRAYLEKFKNRLHELEAAAASEENRKHVREERARLESMILRYERPKKHVFIGYDPAPEVILVTNRCQKSTVKGQITEGTVTELGQGLKIRGGNLKELLALRTYQELLLPISGSHPLTGSPQEIGKELLQLGIPEFLEDNHKKGGCFYYRVEIKGPMPLEKKGSFIRRLTQILDEGSEGRLKNSAAEYEVELRLLERKDGSFVPMLKLYTLPDQRFSYRRESIAASISPVNAALTVELVRSYLKEGAQILDPFCGVGTMLIERNRAVPANPMYGVDIFGEAIEKARENTKRAGCVINYINRDFLDFTHGYLFDEIITDLPRAAGEGGKEKLAVLYRQFFQKAPTHLKNESVMVCYTMDAGLVKECIRGVQKYKLLEDFLINEKNQTRVLVLGVNREG